MVAQAPCDFKTSIIVVYMISKGSNWLWSTWAQSYFRSFLTGQVNLAGGFSKTFLLVSSVFVLSFIYIIV